MWRISLIALLSVLATCWRADAASLAVEQRIGTPWSTPWFCHDLDCPQYETLHKYDDVDVELRRYASGSWVKTTLNGSSYDLTVGEGFQRLFKYISGDNKDKSKMPMTAPVLTKVVSQDATSKEMTVSFFLPYEFQDSPPEPQRDDVALEQSESIDVFVLSYGGYSPEITVMKELSTLKTFLDKEGQSYDSSAFYTANYDSPLRLIGRHNEIWLKFTGTEVAGL